MKTLHLNLIRHWFDMVYKRIKPEEYREITPYWCSKFLLYDGKHKPLSWWQDRLAGLTYENKLSNIASVVQNAIERKVITFKPFDTITFSNGYSKARDQFEIEKLNINIDTGNQDWGATKGKKYFVLTLGKIIKPIAPCLHTN